ncbi:uncharacterized protein LOC121601069 isoform X2 [Anopheles merus]|uniref:uncharacterized protein LOC121601069 isoform X2 n=1 Tax=Anopheles merus TaxID=30066 RepID=UPI001BE46B59|nr:uncharacterized protein LOC121601069 isoform X2 [Anopheles merus]
MRVCACVLRELFFLRKTLTRTAPSTMFFLLYRRTNCYHLIVSMCAATASCSPNLFNCDTVCTGVQGSIDPRAQSLHTTPRLRRAKSDDIFPEPSRLNTRTTTGSSAV